MEKRFLSWPATVIPGLSLSASGLLALADLSTIAKRTAITGTSSWFDALLLAPGIHYQQLAERLGDNRSTRRHEAVNLSTGTAVEITNTATISYLKRVGSMEKSVILDIDSAERGRTKDREKRRRTVELGSRGKIYRPTRPRSSRISVILYFTGPILTIVSMVLMILTRDWWGVGIICALMLARILNIWIIRQRIKDKPPVKKTPNIHENWWMNVDGNNICLRGLSHDLDAMTTGSWMRAKTNIEGYVEAMAKLIVYLVAVFSGNVFQTGNIILLILLLTSAGLLALSNARSDTFNMNGRVANVTDPVPEGKKNSPLPYNSGDYDGVGRPGMDPRVPIPVVVPVGSDGIGVDDGGFESSFSGASDFEKAEAKEVIDTTYPFSDEVNYV